MPISRTSATRSQLAATYPFLIVFSGHHEYVTTHEYDLIERYRSLGGNLMYLFANDFFWRIAQVRKRDGADERSGVTFGRPQAGPFIGVQYRGNDRGEHEGQWIVRDTTAAPWLFKDTGLRRGSRLGSGGIEIDATAPSSPVGTRGFLAEIPNLYGHGFTAQMTYYKTRPARRYSRQARSTSSSRYSSPTSLCQIRVLVGTLRAHDGCSRTSGHD